MSCTNWHIASPQKIINMVRLRRALLKCLSKPLLSNGFIGCEGEAGVQSKYNNNGPGLSVPTMPSYWKSSVRWSDLPENGRNGI